MVDITKRISGVYAIKCIHTNTVYVGASSDIEKRVMNHFSSLRNASHSNKRMALDYTMYGQLSFIVFLLEACEDEILRKEKEQYYIDLIKPNYNVMPASFAPRRDHLIHTPLGRIAYKNNMRFQQMLSKAGLSCTPELYKSFYKGGDIDAGAKKMLMDEFSIDENEFVDTRRDVLRRCSKTIRTLSNAQMNVLLAFPETRNIPAGKKLGFRVRGIVNDSCDDLTQFGVLVREVIIKRNLINKPIDESNH